MARSVVRGAIESDAVLDSPPAETGPPYVSVVVPAFDEAEALPRLLAGITDALEAASYEYEIVVVDDGSRDETFQVLLAARADYPRLRVVRLRRNFGQTAALAAGFRHAQGQVVVTIDADLQNDPADIPTLIEGIEAGNDLVVGWRAKRQDPFLSRVLPSRIANALISAVTGVWLHDYGCTLKAMRSELVRELHLYGEMHRFIPAILSWMGVSMLEVPVRHHPRVYGRSKYGISRTLRVVLDLILVKFLLSYSSRPLQIFGLAGVLSWLLGFSVALMLSYQWLFLQESLADRPLLLLAVLLMVVGFQLLGMGLLGEMVVRAHYESQAKTIYVVRDILETVDSTAGRDADAAP